MQGIRFDGGIQSFTNLAVSADSSLGRLVDKPEFVLLSYLKTSQQYDTCWNEAGTTEKVVFCFT